MKLTVWLVGFAGGVWWFSLSGGGWTLALWWLLLAVGLAMWQQRFSGIAVLFFLGLLVGGVRFQLAPTANPALDARVGEQVAVEALVCAEPEQRENGVRLVLCLPSGDRLIASAPLYPEFKLGDKLRGSGTLRRPEAFATDLGRDFDYPGWLAARNIFFELQFAEFELGERAAAYPVRRSLVAGKNLFLARLERLIPEPQVSLLGGLLVGTKQSLGEEWLTRFQRAGVSHIIVLSGYNLTIVAEFFRALFSRLPLYAGLGVAGASIIAFAVMAGGGAAVARAALMALIALFARGTGRLYDAWRALLAAAALMILWNPRVLVFDLGFQLSFLATAGLIWLAPPLERRLRFLSRRFGLREMVATTLAAQAAVLPWLIYKMGQLSLVAPLVNPFVLVAIPPIMLLGFGGGLLGLLWWPLGWPFALAANFLLSYQLQIIEWASALPLAATTVRHFPLALVILIYASGLVWHFRLNYTRAGST